MKYETRNLQELPKFRDGLSYLYLEHGHLEQQDQAVAYYSQEGVVAIPAAALGVLMLGPGTSITHAAIRQLANNGCSVFWVGEEMVRFYASGMGETRSSANLMRQVRAWADPEAHLEVVKCLYQLRFSEPLSPELSLEQIRGLEGVRVRETYARWSRETGVEWKGVFPAPAGMNRRPPRPGHPPWRIPRTRGDEPSLTFGGMWRLRIPRTRGDEPNVAPADVPSCIPRTRGDEPSS